MLNGFANWLLGSIGRRPRGGKNVPDIAPLKRYFRRTQGMTSFEEASLLYELAKEARNGCIVEVGSYRGRSTVALGRGAMDGNRLPVFAIDPHEEYRGVLGGQFGPEDRAAFFRAMLDSDCYRIVRLVNLSSELVVSRWTTPVALLWIDGDHRYEGVQRDYRCWSPHLTEDATVAFDDSMDPSIGPCKLIGELLETGLYQKTAIAGKVTALKKIAATQTERTVADPVLRRAG